MVNATDVVLSPGLARFAAEVRLLLEHRPRSTELHTDRLHAVSRIGEVLRSFDDLGTWDDSDGTDTCAPTAPLPAATGVDALDAVNVLASALCLTNGRQALAALLSWDGDRRQELARRLGHAASDCAWRARVMDSEGEHRAAAALTAGAARLGRVVDAVFVWWREAVDDVDRTLRGGGA